MKARYAQVSRRMVRDAKFRQLSAWARLVFRDLLGHPQGDHVPGFVVDDLRGIAKNTALEEADVERAIDELTAAGMVRFDAEADLFWLPNGLKHNGAANPNQVTGWAKQLLLLPESALIAEAAPTLIAHAQARAEESGSDRWDVAVDSLRKAFLTVSQTVRKTVSKHGSVSVSVDESVDGDGEIARAHEAALPPEPEPTDCPRSGGHVSESATTDDEKTRLAPCALNDGTATGFVASLYDQAALSSDLPPARPGEATKASARIAAVTHNATGSSSLSPEAIAWWRMALGRIVESRNGGGFLAGKDYVRLSWLVKRLDDGKSPIERAAIGGYEPDKRKRDPPRRRDRADELFESVARDEARAEGVIDVEYELDEEYAG